ncbi:ribosomal protein S18 [Desulfitispora alkaliphila]
MRKIEISNQLADQLNFKNLRGLKMSISRTFGKGTIQDNQVEVDRAIKSC